eukprot:2264440-Prymnesium_polylepis.1
MSMQTRARQSIDTLAGCLCAQSVACCAVHVHVACGINQSSVFAAPPLVPISSAGYHVQSTSRAGRPCDSHAPPRTPLLARPAINPSVCVGRAATRDTRRAHPSHRLGLLTVWALS